MKPMTNPAPIARHALATTLFALFAAPFASAQSDAEALRQLQEETAALRKQLAEYQAKGVTAPAIPPSAPASTTTTPTTTTTTTTTTTRPPTTVTPTTTTTTSTAVPTADEVQVLTPFEVNTDK